MTELNRFPDAIPAPQAKNELTRFLDGASVLQVKKDDKKLRKRAGEQGKTLTHSQALALAAAQHGAPGHWNKVMPALASAKTETAPKLLPLNPPPPFALQPATGDGSGLWHRPVEATAFPQAQGPRAAQPPAAPLPPLAANADLEDEPDEPPECVVCGQVQTLFSRLIPVGETQDVIHIGCMHDEYGFCQYCEWSHEKIAWPVDELNNAGECPNHAGESSLDPDEEQDRDDYIENIRNNH